MAVPGRIFVWALTTVICCSITVYAQNYNSIHNQQNVVTFIDGMNGIARDSHSHRSDGFKAELEKHKDGSSNGMGSTPVADFQNWLRVKAKEHREGNVVGITTGDIDGLAETPLGNISQACYEDVVTLFADMDASVAYAMKMYSSWGEATEWIVAAYRWSAQSYGQFEMCKGIDKGVDGAPFDAEYCVLYYPLVAFAGIRAEIGSCWPSSCSSEDLETAHRTYLGPIGEIVDLTYDCIIRETWSGGAIATLCLLGMLATSVAIGSIYHVVFHDTVTIALTAPKVLPPDEAAEENNIYEQVVEDEESGGGYEIPTGAGNGSTGAMAETEFKKESPSNNNNNTTKEEAAIDRLDSDEKKSDGMTKLVIEEEKQLTGESSKRLALIDGLLMAWSAFHNNGKIFSASPPSFQTFGALNGIRVLSLWWVILGHSNSFLLVGNRYDNIPYGIGISETTASQAIFNGTYSVDTFLVLSGFLVTYLTLKELAKTNGHVNWFLFYVHRYLRLTPLLMLAVAVTATMPDHLTEGPGKNAYFDGLEEVCQNTWWTHPLYINNLYPFPGNVDVDSCVGWAWYLAIDMQFYIISPFIIYLLWKNWKWGMGLIVTLCLVSFGATAYITWYWGLGVGGTGLYNNRTQVDPDVTSGDSFTYSKPYCRISTYLVGMTLGLIMYKLNGKRVKMSKLVLLVGWALAIAIGTAVIYGIMGTYRGPQSPQWLAITYATISRCVFGIAVSWVIFVCITGNGGYVNDFLAWEAWVPLARLSYAAYIVHPMIIMIAIHNLKTTFHWTYLTCSYWFIANIVASYAFAWVVSLLVEGPFAGMEKVLIGGRRKSSGTAPEKKSS